MRVLRDSIAIKPNQQYWHLRYRDHAQGQVMSLASTTSPIFIVEDLQEIRLWLSQLVTTAFPNASVETACTLQEARQLIQQYKNFQLALVDLGLPDGSGISLISEMQALQPNTPVIVTTVHDDDDHLFNALAAGASGYLLKEQDDAQLLLSLRQFEAGQPPLSPRIAKRILQHFQKETTARNLASPLTPRETDVLALIGRGLRAREVAAQLQLTESTVTSYVKNIYAKLNISNRAEAALEASRRGLT